MSVKLMEICGTHTMSIARAGIRSVLPEGVELISGPGCPVCVTPDTVIDTILQLTSDEAIRPMICTYGDMIRVPGSLRGDNLRTRMALGADVRIVFSSEDAVRLARENPDREVVFLGVGFETTAPGTAAAIGDAAALQLKNFSVLPMLKTCEPALRALIADPEFAVNGFICPGHVAVITGEDGFRFLAEEFHLPAVISGFEPEDIMKTVSMLVRQLQNGEAKVENEYSRAVSTHGNALALRMIEKYLDPVDALWRGLGRIPASGLGIRKEYAQYDAIAKFGLTFADEQPKTACRCGDVIRGKLDPKQCPMFGICTPEDPVGPCMVSSEGACAAAYKYSY